MGRTLGLDAVIDHFTLIGDELDLLRNKSGASRLGFAARQAAVGVAWKRAGRLRRSSYERVLHSWRRFLAVLILVCCVVLSGEAPLFLSGEAPLS
jgi:hypothetical protein